MDEKEIITYLERDRIKNVSLLYFMQNNPVHYVKKIGDSVVLKGRSDQDWTFISCYQPTELVTILESLGRNDRYFASLESWMMPFFHSRFAIEWMLTTARYYLPEKVIVELPSHLPIRPLRAEEAAYIYEHSDYQSFTSVDYLKMRIENGPSAGIDQEGRLVAWILTHDDLAIGSLHVLESARRKGYAMLLTQYMIVKLRQQGIIPFVQIEPTNAASLKLVEKIGFRFDREVNWVALK